MSDRWPIFQLWQGFLLCLQSRWACRWSLNGCMVGTVGFAVDAGTTMLLTQTLAVAVAPARVIAFVVAASVTWVLNQRFTFRAGSGLATWLPYVLSTSLGALVNIGIYLLWLRWAGHSPTQIVVGVAIGSVCALLFNYTIAKQLIFRGSGA